MTTEYTPDQIDDLRLTAKNLGCKVGNTRDVAKLQEMINEARADMPSLTETNSKQAKRRQARQDALKLVRVRVTPMSPFYKQMSGATFTVGNSLVGNVSRHVQFNEEWHVEEILLKSLQNKKYRTKVEKTDPTTRRTVYDNKFHNAFGIEILKPLSDAELKELAAAQQARASVD